MTTLRIRRFREVVNTAHRVLDAFCYWPFSLTVTVYPKDSPVSLRRELWRMKAHPKKNVRRP